MGCGDACPFYTGERYLDWKLEDPAGKDTDTVLRSAAQAGSGVSRMVNVQVSRVWVGGKGDIA